MIKGSAGIIIFFCVLLWILIDIRLMRKRKFPAPAPVSVREVTARQIKQGSYFLIGLSIVLYSGAYSDWRSPSHPPFTGRLSALDSVLYYGFGPKAISVMWFIIATAILLIGIISLVKTTDSWTRKKPP